MSNRPEHFPTGDICDCGVPASGHRIRKRANRPKPGPQSRIIGIDGEGEGAWPHRYTYLGAADESGETWGVANPEGLGTAQCLELILSLPRRATIVGFAFGYDLTMMLRELPNKDLWKLLHEESRAALVDGKVHYRPVRWGEYQLSYMNGRFTVRKGEHTRTVWDCFRFYACSFVQALTNWGIATKADLARMVDMKGRRGTFTQAIASEVQAYCLEECNYLAKLFRALLSAHKEAGLDLTSYYGAGSTASALLGKMGIKEQIKPPPQEAHRAVACAFFGGRFENSVIGPVPGEVWNYDISSAYPYHTTFLPCLACGTWERVESPSPGLLRRATLALVRWHLPPGAGSSWGPWPVRKPDGSIIYPASAEGGWIWEREWSVGKALFPQAVAREAWLYHTDCEHRPFADIPGYYRERVRLGKEGKGLVLKLGTNSVYGKLAQSKGRRPPFQCFTWAGLITSNTRAQLLELMGADLDAVLMVATDGVWSRRPLPLPLPRDTGTSDLAKPLGGWEAKAFPGGVFCARPGIYFPLNPTADQVKEVRARGLGKANLLDQCRALQSAWERGEPSYRVEGGVQFMAAKHSLHKSEGKGYQRSPSYGEWLPHPIVMSFDPAPKRARVAADNRLEVIEGWEIESQPYSPAIEREAHESGQLDTGEGIDDYRAY